MLEELIKNLSQEEATQILQELRRQNVLSKKKKTATKVVTAKKKQQIKFVMRFESGTFTQTAKKSDIIQHFMETLLPNIVNMPPHAVKSQIVSIFEMLAETEANKVDRDRWRKRAVKVIMIDNQEHLNSYVITLATGITAELQSCRTARMH